MNCNAGARFPAFALCLLALVASCATRRPVAAANAATRPEVREPVFRIESVTIERDLLVTTKLSLSLAVDNPNDFPIELSSLSYEFYGEGDLWTEGSSEDAETAPERSVPARASLERKLSFTMNFANMDRRLFDLVAKLEDSQIPPQRNGEDLDWYRIFP